MGKSTPARGRMSSTVGIPGFNMCGVVIEEPAGAADTPPVLRLDSVSKWGFLAGVYRKED
jgi:hypothetical protein